MYSSHLVVGIAPTKRGILSLEEAVKQKERYFAALRGILTEHVTLVDIDDVCEQGILCKRDQVGAVVEKFRTSGVDALFFPFCDFGEEQPVAEVARSFRIPTLIWGERDERPNTYEKRGKDTQCGMFAATRVLKRFGITYSYIYSCRVDSREFRNGYENFIRAANVVKEIRNTRIGKIGSRPDPFASVVANEGDLTEKLGIVTVPISVAQVAKRTMEVIEENGREYREYYQNVLKRYDVSAISCDHQKKIAGIKIAVAQLLSEYGCTSAAMQCWPAFVEQIGIRPCLTLGEMSGERIPIACECDLNGAVTLTMLRAVSLSERPTFFADMTIRHPENDNAELLWHCGQFPYELKDEACPARIKEGRQVFRLRSSGQVTIARFEESGGELFLFAGEGHTVEGPETTCTYTWFETENWKAWEEKLMFGPYIHHVGGIFGHYKRALKEAMRYLPVIFDPAEDDGSMSL